MPGRPQPRTRRPPNRRAAKLAFHPSHESEAGIRLLVAALLDLDLELVRAGVQSSAARYPRDVPRSPMDVTWHFRQFYAASASALGFAWPGRRVIRVADCFGDWQAGAAAEPRPASRLYDRGPRRALRNERPRCQGEELRALSARSILAAWRGGSWLYLVHLAWHPHRPRDD